ncbi:unnamed protein product [Citrullus colocynthis]|uniref:Uncharacterized protein n=1 Tax=Citrullus colocynthis TaxID=252529 RepID=A0ABP0XY28_9ROSI
MLGNFQKNSGPQIEYLPNELNGRRLGFPRNEAVQDSLVIAGPVTTNPYCGGMKLFEILKISGDKGFL